MSLFKHTHLGHVVGVLQVWALWDINRTQMQHNRSPVCLSVLSCITPLLDFSCVSHSILSIILSSPGSTLSLPVSPFSAYLSHTFSACPFLLIFITSLFQSVFTEFTSTSVCTERILVNKVLQIFFNNKDEMKNGDRDEN